MYRRCKFHQNVLYSDGCILPEKTDHLHFSIINPLDSCGILSKACFRRKTISSESCKHKFALDELPDDANALRINPRRCMCRKEAAPYETASPIDS